MSKGPDAYNTGAQGCDCSNLLDVPLYDEPRVPVSPKDLAYLLKRIDELLI